MDAELVHTDKRQLQRSLVHDLQTLRVLTDRIRAGAASDMKEAVSEIV